MKILMSVFFFGLLLIANINAYIFHIPSVDHPTIQAGIDSAMTGDTALVQPGTYLENISFNGKNIVLGSLFLTTGDTTLAIWHASDHYGQLVVYLRMNGIVPPASRRTN